MEPARDLFDTTHPLPDVFARWFASRGWQPRVHQLDLLAKAGAGRSTLLIAPTGGGKTLAGFLPTLVELSERGEKASPRMLRTPSPREAVGRVGVGGNAVEAPLPPTPDPSPPLASLAGGGEDLRQPRVLIS